MKGAIIGVLYERKDIRYVSNATPQPKLDSYLKLSLSEPPRFLKVKEFDYKWELATTCFCYL